MSSFFNAKMFKNTLLWRALKEKALFIHRVTDQRRQVRKSRNIRNFRKKAALVGDKKIKRFKIIIDF